jgi:hypothetical protein
MSRLQIRFLNFVFHNFLYTYTSTNFGRKWRNPFVSLNKNTLAQYKVIADMWK